MGTNKQLTNFLATTLRDRYVELLFLLIAFVTYRGWNQARTPSQLDANSAAAVDDNSSSNEDLEKSWHSVVIGILFAVTGMFFGGFVGSGTFDDNGVQWGTQRANACSCAMIAGAHAISKYPAVTSSYLTTIIPLSLSYLSAVLRYLQKRSYLGRIVFEKFTTSFCGSASAFAGTMADTDELLMKDLDAAGISKAKAKTKIKTESDTTALNLAAATAESLGWWIQRSSSVCNLVVSITLSMIYVFIFKHVHSDV